MEGFPPAEPGRKSQRGTMAASVVGLLAVAAVIGAVCAQIQVETGPFPDPPNPPTSAPEKRKQESVLRWVGAHTPRIPAHSHQPRIGQALRACHLPLSPTRLTWAAKNNSPPTYSNMFFAVWWGNDTQSTMFSLRCAGRSFCTAEYGAGFIVAVTFQGGAPPRGEPQGLAIYPPCTARVFQAPHGCREGTPRGRNPRCDARQDRAARAQAGAEASPRCRHGSG